MSLDPEEIMLMKMGLDDMRAGIHDRDYIIGDLRAEIARHHHDFEKIRAELDFAEQSEAPGVQALCRLLRAVVG